MRKYEVMFIVRPDVVEDDVDKLITQMQGAVTSHGGAIEKVEKMGRRRLAYHIGRYKEGFYVLFVLEGSGDTVREFERRLKVTDLVIKMLTVRTDEEIKRADKFKELRAKQRSRKHRSREGSAQTQQGSEAGVPAP